MIIDLDDICVCGHQKGMHELPVVNGIPTHSFGCSCEKFKLDNLAYVEKCAKLKELV